jgi:hypothetical protein
MLVVHAAEVLPPDELREVVSSLNEWTCDLLNDEAQPVMTDHTPFPYEQGMSGQ